MRSYGTEDRETQFPVAPQTQVYDYILFRGSDIKDIRVLNNVPTIANDPAIMQMSVPPSLTPGTTQGQYGGQFNHPVVGQAGQQYAQYHPMSGFPTNVHAQLNKTSELSPQASVDLAPQPQPATAPIGSGVIHHANQVKDQGLFNLENVSFGLHMLLCDFCLNKQILCNLRVLKIFGSEIKFY